MTDFGKRPTDDEVERLTMRLTVDAAALEARRQMAEMRSPKMVNLRRWAIERLLAMPGAEEMLRPGQIADEGVADEPFAGAVHPKLFAIADDLVFYVETGIWGLGPLEDEPEEPEQPPP